MEPLPAQGTPKGLHEEVLEQARARVGKILCGKYRVDRLIGTGGMASVYEGTHLRNANRVALKILHRDLAISADVRTRFLREGYAANSVDHPGTVRVLDDDRAEDSSIFLVMELLDGETLDARFERSHGKLGVPEVVTLIIDALDVLAAAHAKGVVHRDIKPENLFLTREGKIKVLDFGIARVRVASHVRTGGDGTPLGTPAFMPPEQALAHNDEVDARSDVWAVGATAFTLLSGHHVHESPTTSEMLVRRCTIPAPRLASLAPHVPAEIAAAIDRALAFEREDRWPSAEAMRDALIQARSAAADPLDDEDPEEHTKVTPPARVTQPEIATQPIELDLVARGASAETQVAASRGARLARARRDRVAVAIGSGAALVIVLAFTLFSSRAPTRAMAVAPPLVAPNGVAPSSELPAAVTAEPSIAEAAPSASETPPAVALSAPKPAPSAPRARPAAPSQVAGGTTPTRPAPLATHDPLSPW
jgi:serine/threonine-protein kinase